MQDSSEITHSENISISELGQHGQTVNTLLEAVSSADSSTARTLATQENLL